MRFRACCLIGLLRARALPPSIDFTAYKRICCLPIVICELVIAAVPCVYKQSRQGNRIMQSSTIIVLACLVAAVAASVHYEQLTDEHDVSNVDESHDTPVHERSARTKRGLLLLKKKLILGALGLKAAKVGAVGAGVVGAIALKKQSVPKVIIEADHRHPKLVEVHSWSG